MPRRYGAMYDPYSGDDQRKLYAAARENLVADRIAVHLTKLSASLEVGEQRNVNFVGIAIAINEEVDVVVRIGRRYDSATSNGMWVLG